MSDGEALFPSGAGVLVDAAGSGTLTINSRPNAADPIWGLTQSHVNKHLVVPGKNSLRQIDLGGSPDIWRNSRKNGVEEVICAFPRTGSGTFQFGIRIAPGSSGTWDLITLLAKQ